MATAQEAIDALAAKQGVADSVTPTNLSVTLQDIYNDPNDDPNVIIVTEADDFGVIDGSKTYRISGFVDITGSGVNLEVPAGGINLTGNGVEASRLICSDAAYQLFTSPVGGSGNVNGKDVSFQIDGAGSSVMALEGATGNEAIELVDVNFIDCTSGGYIDNYRQGRETGTGRFGGGPEIELRGVWSGGWFVETSVCRGLAAGFAGSLYKAGVGFLMSSRFRSNANIDLPASASFFDFAPANFVNPSTVQMDRVIITRNGVINSSDTNLTPNMTAADLSSSWKGCLGLDNTFEGGKITTLTEVDTVIATQGSYVTLVSGSHLASELQHFDNPAGTQLRHLGIQPRAYKIVAHLTIDGPQNEEIAVRVRKWDDSASSFVDSLPLIVQVNSLVGGRDVAFFPINENITLDQNDYVFFQVANISSTSDVTLESSSYYDVEAR
jgi:hypothetical protein